MKIIRPVLFTTLFLFALSSLQAQVSTTDSLVHKAFASLKTKDEQAFLALYPTAPQFTRFTRSLMEQVLNSDAMKQIFAMDEKAKNMNIDSLIQAEVDKVSSPEEYKKMQDKFTSSFHNTLQKGEAKGVRWSEAKLTGYTIDSAVVADKAAEQFNLTGLKEAKGVIDFSVGDSAYQLVFDKMMYLPGEGGWFGVDFPQLVRKGESLQPEKEPTSNAATQKKTGTTKEKAPAVKKSNAPKAPVRKKSS